ncbi:MAG: hypothetical protein N3G76_00490 [Candidatus Micrarchaeota archaeon]|nr:hypothetical protein [Candidatus Micrarchaeota archaeon]
MGLDDWSAKEKVLLFAGIPLVLCLAYLLPEGLKEAYFILDTHSPSVPSLFLSNYTHSALPHLAVNILFYLITVFLILKLEAGKPRFYTTLVFLLVVAPFLISIFTVMFFPARYVQGFSGIVAGLMGYFVYVVYRHVKETWKLSADISFVCLLFCVNALVALLGYHVHEYIILTLLIVLAALAYLNRGVLSGIAHILLQKYAGCRATTCSFILEYLTFVFALILLFSLPALIQLTASDAGISNVIGHYAGYTAGFLFPLILFERERQGN